MARQGTPARRAHGSVPNGRKAALSDSVDGQRATARDPGDEVLDVVVIGGSQAGLAMAWHLARQHLRLVVLEAGPEPGQTWRSRWDSLTLFTPAQYDAPPACHFPDRRIPTRVKNWSPTTSTPMQRGSTCRSGSTPGSPH